MVGVGHHPILGINVGAIIRRRLNVDDLAVGMSDQEIGGAATVRLHYRQQRFVERPGIQNLAAADMERLAKSVGAVPLSYQAVDAQADPSGIHAHLATGNACLSETDKVRL